MNTSVRMRENMDQKNSEYEHFWRDATVKVLAMRFNPSPEAYLEPTRTFTMELFCENS